MAKERVAPKLAGTVTTPAVKRPGNGPEWDALRKATTADELAELDYKASEMGYGDAKRAPNGLRAAIAAKLKGVKHG